MSNKRAITIGGLVCILLLGVLIFFCRSCGQTEENYQAPSACNGKIQMTWFNGVVPTNRSSSENMETEYIRCAQERKRNNTFEKSGFMVDIGDDYEYFKPTRNIPTGDNNDPINLAPTWVLSWSPPTKGVGPGYNTTYSGSFTSKTSGKLVYSFDKVAGTTVNIPPTAIPPDTYTIQIYATNQFGKGVPYSQDVAVANHAPVIIDAGIQFQNPNYNAIFVGNFPDITTNSMGSWTLNFGLTDENGKNIPTTFAANWSQIAKDGKSAAGLVVSWTPSVPLGPGQTIFLGYSICNFTSLCSTGRLSYTASGVVPGPASNIHMQFV